MTWDFYGEGEDFVLKAEKQKPKEVLDSLDAKGRKKLKKTLQAAEPTEFFGQDFTKLGDLISTLRELDLTKSDKCIFVGTPEQLINKYKQDTNNDG